MTAAAVPTDLLRDFDRRIAAVLESVRGDGTAWDVPEGLARQEPLPHWIELPLWLDQSWGSGSVPGERLADILWGQYALFLFIRIQDDLLDRHRTDLDSMLVADRFLIESLDSFDRVFILDGRFRNQYRAWLRDTVDGIREVARIESTAGGFTADHLPLHAKVCAIFKVGSLALCRVHGRERDWPWIDHLLDLVAQFSQIGDDLVDLGDDVRAGRHTWPANVMSGGFPAPEPNAWLLHPERGDVILEKLRGLAGAAAALLPPGAPAPIRALARGLSTRVDELERGMHEAAVRMVFGDVLTGTAVKE